MTNFIFKIIILIGFWTIAVDVFDAVIKVY